MFNSFISSTIFAIFVGCGITLDALKTSQQDLKPEEYAVYSALINSITSSISDGAILIHDQTLISAGAQQLDGGIEADVRDDFIAKNKDSHLLRPYFKLTNEYQLTPSASDEPGVQTAVLVIELSRAGVNRAEDQAIVRIKYGGMGGMGWKDQLVVLKKREGKWEVERKIVRMVP